MKATTRKRLFSILLVLTILLSCCPAAFAEGEEPEESYVEENIPEEENYGEDNDVEIDYTGEGQGPGEGQEPGEGEAPAEGEDPAEGEVPAEGQEPGEDEETEEEEEPEEEPEEKEPALVLLRVVSAQAISFRLYGAEVEIAPATEEELAAWTAAQAAPAEKAALLFTAEYLLPPGSYTWSAEAEGVRAKENVALELTENFALEITLEKGLPYGLKGMPEGWTPSAQDLEKKQALIDHNVPALIAGLTPGTDYLEGEVWFLCDSEEYARTVAEAYSAELTEFSYGVATLRLTTATVPEAVAAAADPELPLPVVSANQIVTPEPDWGPSGEVWGGSSLKAGEDAPSLYSWERIRDEYGSSLDPFLCDPTNTDYRYTPDPGDTCYQYMHSMVNTYEAWGVTLGDGVKVAVIDGGVYDHDELTIKGHYNLAGGSYASYMNHGTHVAGIIAAGLGNSMGGAGIAPGAWIYDLQVFGSTAASGTNATITRAINMARELKVDVINMSLGGFIYDEQYFEELKGAIQDGITVVAAMGNESSNAWEYPAAYSIPGLIAVGSVTPAGTRSHFSNYGAGEDVLAPGSDMLSTVTNNGYDFKNGTSMAAPVVSGVAALYISQNLNAEPAEVEKAIKAATTGGIVDASKLFLKETAAPEIDASASMGEDGKLIYGTPLWVTPNAASRGNFMVFTTDGSNPAVKDGVVTVGTVMEGWNNIDVTEENGFIPGRRVTLKVISVSDVGVVSKMASRTFTVGSYISGIDIVDPGRIRAGTSVTLKAVVLPEGVNQTVTWEISSNSGCPGTHIDAKTGVLSTKAGDEGFVEVEATSTEASLPVGTLKIYIQPINPVKKVVVSANSPMLANSGYEYVSAEAFDAAGDPVPGVDFTWTSSNKKVLTVENDSTGQARVHPVGKGRATITATSQDGSKVSGKLTVEVQVRADVIEISGPRCVAPGKSATYKAKILPTNANDKTVTWRLEEAPEGVAINEKTGRLSVPNNTLLEGESFSVIAEWNGRWGPFCVSYAVSIEPQVSALKIDMEDGAGFSGGGVITDQDDWPKTITLYSVETDYYLGSEKSWQDSWTDLRAVSLAYGDEPPVTWKSSNPKVATVDENGFVQAVGAGTTTVTAKVSDLGGKTAKVTVKVINPASSLTLCSSALTASGYYYICPDKTVKHKAVLGDAFGKPSIGKVNWYLDISPSYLEDEILGKKLVTISSSGALSVKAGMKAYVDEKIYITVGAMSTDRMRVEDSIEYQLVAPHTKVLLYNFEKDSYVTSYTDPDVMLQGSYRYYDIYPEFGLSGWNVCEYVVKSGNPAVAGAVVEYDKYGNPYVKVISNNEGRAGTAVITITAADGSGKSAKLTVRVQK